MRSRTLLSTLAVGATVVAMAHETERLYHDPGFLLAALMLVAAICLPGMLLRLVLPRASRWSWPTWLLQGAAGVGMLLWLVRGPLGGLLQEAVAQINEGAAPLEASPGMRFLLLCAIGIVTLLCELFLHVGRMPALTILPLGAWYTVFALVPTPPARALSLVIVAIGWGTIVAVDTLGRVGRWRRLVHDDSGTGEDAVATTTRVAAIVLAPALVGALVLGASMPMFQREELGSSPGAISMGDPRLDLRQNLHARDRREVLAYRSSLPGGVRLRNAVLTKFDADGWNLSAFPSTRLDRPAQAFGQVPGLTATAGTPRSTRVSIDTFPSQYLPLPYAPRSLAAPRTWGYDPGTLMTYTLEDRSATNHLEYQVESLDVTPSAAVLDTATSTLADAVTRERPADLPGDIVTLAEQLTAGAPTPLQRAVALQDYFREGSFTYDLDEAPTLGGYEGIEQFLFVERVGYCEQYAGAYAALARAVGLPSRVVIGFLPGRQQEDGRWAVANLDMHAWPEVFFDGYGWLPFEPTPPQVSGEAPGYARAAQAQQPEPTVTPTPTPTAEPSQVAPPTPTEPVTPDPSTTGQSVPWAAILGWTLGVLGVVALVGLPWFLRRRRRAAAFAAVGGDDGVERLWGELRDTVLDHRGTWPADTPRALAARVSDGLPAPTAHGLARLAVQVERTRFAATPGRTDDAMAAAVRDLEQQLQGSATRLERLCATLLPRSLWAALRRR